MAGRKRFRLAAFRSPDAKMSIELGLATLAGPVGGFIANVVIARTLGASGRGELAAVVAALGVCEAGVVDLRTTGHLGPSYCKGLASSWRPSHPGDRRDRRVDHSRRADSDLLPQLGLLLARVRGRRVDSPLDDSHRHRAWSPVGPSRLPRTLTASQLVGSAIRLVAPFSLILAERPTENLGLLVILSWYIAAAIPIFACRPFAGRAAAIREALPIFREALTLWPVQVAWILQVRLDQLVLAASVTPADLGRYAVCAAIAEPAPRLLVVPARFF